MADDSLKNLQADILAAKDEEESLSVVINAIAGEVAALATVETDEEAKVPAKRLDGLKKLAELIEKRKKIREQKVVDVDHVARKLTLFFIEQSMGVLDDMEADDETKQTFASFLKVRVKDWEAIRERLISAED